MLNEITDAHRALINSFRPDTLRICFETRQAFPKMNDGEFVDHLNNLGVPRAEDLMFATRVKAYVDGTIGKLPR